jgi:hypothetical protein
MTDMKKSVAGLIETTARSLATKDQMDWVLRTWEDLASRENVNSEYVQVLRHAIRLLDEAPDLPTFLYAVRRDFEPEKSLLSVSWRVWRQRPLLTLLVAVIFVVIWLGTPFAWGRDGAPFWAPLIWSAVMAFSNVATRWRLGTHGVLLSYLAGVCFAAVGIFPAYLLGRFLSGS